VTQLQVFVYYFCIHRTHYYEYLYGTQNSRADPRMESVDEMTLSFAVIIIPGGLSFRREHLHRAPQQPSNPISELRLVTSDAPLSDDRRSRIDRFVETWNRSTELITL